MKYIAQKSVTSIMLLVGITVFFSSFTLWIIDSWIKYPLFILESVAIITIYCVLSNYDIGNSFETVNRFLPGEKSRGLILDVILIASALVLIMLNGFHTTIGGVFQLVLAFISASFLSGHALLNIFRLTIYFSKLEILVLSYLGSFIFSAFVSLFLLPIDENMRTIVLPICYLALGIISALRRYKSKRLNEVQPAIITRPYSFSKNIDILAIALSVAFYVMFLSFIYPNAALLPGTDISRHYGASVILSRSPDLYGSDISEVLFHAFEAAVLVMSGIQQSVAQVQTVLVVLNVLLPLAVYVLAKRFLSDIDKRIPAISVIFYTILSNFSFVYYTQLKLLGTTVSQINNLVADRTYNGNIYFLQPVPFFVPLSVSVILFVIAFLLLRENNVPRAKFVLLFSTLIFSMYLTHAAEAVVFTIFLGIYSFVSRSKTLRIDDALVSSLIALMAIASISILWTAAVDQTYSIGFLNILALFFPSILVSGALIWRKTVLRRIMTSLNNKVVSRPIFYQILSVALTLIYLLGFLTWFLMEDLKTSPLVEIGTVPWFIYPVLLGIAGLLAVLSISYVRHIMPDSSVILLLSAIGFMFLLGRLISLVSINIMILDYWEKRLLGLIFIPVCLLAPISLIGLKDRIHTITKDKKNLSSLRNISVLTLVSIIVFSGFSSMALQSEYWLTTSSRVHISEKEFEAINFLKDVFQRDVHAYVIPPSAASKDVLTFAAPPYQFSQSELLVASVYPDLPLVTLNARNLTHAYLYLHNRDLNVVNEERHGWLTHHLLPLLPVIFSNKEVTIYNATSVSFPVSNSNTALVIPTDAHDNSWFYAYDVVSQSRINYTVMYDKDPNALKSRNVILSFDPGSSIYEKFSSGTSNRWEIIKGNWNSSSRGLVVEDNSDSLQNVILSPSRYAATDFNISTSFKIIKINPRAASYVSIVYSWSDPKNYESAGVTLRSNGVYVNFVKSTNGKLTFEPSWPGIKTNLSWRPNEVLNMTLHINEKSKSVSLKGIDDLLGNIAVTLQIPNEDNKDGYVGLGYGRGVGVVFDDFKINEPRSFPLTDYIRYVTDGGNLVVLNTNGYGEIADSVFNMSLFSQVKDNNKMPTLSDNIENRGLIINSLESGASKKGSTKWITSLSLVQELDIGRGKITYVNVYPLLSRFFENNSLGNEAYKALGKISKVINLAPTGSTYNLDISAILRNFTGNADNIEVDTKSVMFPSETHLDKLEIRSGQKTVEVANVSHLLINDYHHALLGSTGVNSKISMARGAGLYTVLTLSNGIDQKHINSSSSHSQSFYLSLVNNGTLSVSNYSSPQETHHFYNVSSVYINSNEPLEVMVRQPTVRITNGQITLNKLYSVSDELSRKTGADLVDLKVLGNMSISIIMADKYALAKLNTWDGTLQRVPALPQYNELGAILPNLTLTKIYSIPPLILLFSLIPFLIGVIFLIYSPRKRADSTSNFTEVFKSPSEK